VKHQCFAWPLIPNCEEVRKWGVILSPPLPPKSETWSFPSSFELVIMLKRKLNAISTLASGLKANKRAFKRQRRDNGPIARQAKRTGGWANPSRGGELKFVDTTITTAVPINGTFNAGTLLNGMANGSDASTRIGRKVNIKSLLLRWSFRLSTTTTAGGNIRFIVVYDKQSNAAAPVITDILLADAFDSPNNLSNRDRFVTLMDVITPAIGTSGDYAVAGVGYKRLNLETMFNAGSAGTIGDITSGSIYVFAASSNSFLTTALVQLTRARIRYSDV